MPATRMLGRRWQVSTDILPLFAIFSAAFYVLWIVYIVIAFFVTVDIRGCNDSGTGRNYLATVCLFLTEYVVSMLTAVCITIIGLRGQHASEMRQVASLWVEIVSCLSGKICLTILQELHLRPPNEKSWCLSCTCKSSTGLCSLALWVGRTMLSWLCTWPTYWDCLFARIFLLFKLQDMVHM